MLGRCGTGSALAASAAMPLMKPGRVTRVCIDTGSWQSMQLTGCASPTCASPVAPAGGGVVAGAWFPAVTTRGALPPGKSGTFSPGVPSGVFSNSARASANDMVLESSKPFITAGQLNPAARASASAGWPIASRPSRR